MRALSLCGKIFAFANLLAHAHASIAVHYFGQKACTANTAISYFSNAVPTAEFTECVAAPSGTAALYVDGVDAGCTVRTYSDASCSDVLGLSLSPGTCYFSETSNIGSFRAVCTAGLGESSSTVTVSLVSSAAPTAGTGSVPESTPADLTTVGTDIGAVLTSVETVTPTLTASPPTDGAPIATDMPVPGSNGSGNGSGNGNGSNGTEWSLTNSWQTPNPSVSPGLQGAPAGGFGNAAARLGVVGAQKTKLQMICVVGLLSAGWFIWAI